MNDAIQFLRKSAEELRDLASSAPDISEELRRLADEIDKAANDLLRGIGRGAPPRTSYDDAGIPQR